MEARVAKILEDGRKFVLNKGKKDGITEGAKFMIVEKTDEDVVDPETGKVLGKLEIPKGKVKIVYATDTYAVAESDEYTEINLFGFSKKREVLPLTDVKVGDYAVKLGF